MLAFGMTLLPDAYALPMALARAQAQRGENADAIKTTKPRSSSTRRRRRRNARRRDDDDGAGRTQEALSATSVCDPAMLAG